MGSLRFRIKNSGIDETEVVTFRMIVNRYKQECKKKYLKDHIYLKDFLGYYFSARDDTNDNGADIYLKFTIDFGEGDADKILDTFANTNQI